MSTDIVGISGGIEPGPEWPVPPAMAPGSPDAGPGDGAEPQLADVVARLRRAMRRAARAQGRGGALPGGLSVAQLELLSALADAPGARPGQLARSLRLAPSSVATLVNGLLRDELITRTGGATDRRTAMIRLTPAGQEAVLAWQRVNAHLLRIALAEMGAASRSALLASLPALGELADAVDALADTAEQSGQDGTSPADGLDRAGRAGR